MPRNLAVNRQAAINRSLVRSTSLTLTTSGGLITDATRTTNTDGDGLTPPAGFGIWEATTNLITNGGFESNTNLWTQSFGAGGTTVTRDTSLFKFGTASGHFSGGSGQGTTFINISSSTAYSWSFWIFVANGATVNARRLERNSGGTTTADVRQLITGTGAWQRVVMSFTSTSTTANVAVGFIFNGTATELWLDGAQLEKNSIATPYVETNGATASRTTGSVSTSSSLMSTTTGWVAVCFTPSRTPDNTGPNYNLFFLGIDNSSGDPSISLAARDVGTGILTLLTSRNGSQTATHQLNGIVSGQTIIAIMKWDATTQYVSGNGSTPFDSSPKTAGVNVPNILRFGNFRNDSPDCNILWAAGGRGSLTSSDITTINGFGGTPPAWSQLLPLNGGYASPSLLWPALTSSATQASRFGLVQARNPAV